MGFSILAGLHTGSAHPAPSRPAVTVEAVLKTLTAASVPDADPLRVVNSRPLVGEVSGVGVILKGKGIVLSYTKRGESDTAVERVAVTLDHTVGTLTISFDRGAVSKLIVGQEVLAGANIPRDARGDLGSILRHARLLVRDYIN